MMIPSCIPTPPFGLSELPPAVPNPWTAPRAGFYYVDESVGSDVSNPFGAPSRPRRTLPNPMPAGAVIVVRGLQTSYYGSPNTLLALGTLQAPVFLLGVPATDGTPCRFTQDGLELTGSYLIAIGVSFYAVNLIDPRLGGQTSQALVLRQCEVAGDVNGGGVAIGDWHGGSVVGCVIADSSIHDTGDVNAITDQDRHGVAVGHGTGSSHHHWILGTKFERCSGDGVQVNGGDVGWQNVHHVFVGGCQMIHNRQSGAWSKQAADVIFAGNKASQMRPNSGGPGLGFGGQYGPLRLWLIDNEVADCENGLVIADYSSPFGTGVFAIGNLLHGIHESVPDAPGQAAWWRAGAAIGFRGAGTQFAMNNTIYDCDAAVQVPQNSGTAIVFGNIFAKLARAVIAVETPGPGFVSGYNLFDVPPTVVVGGTTVSPTVAQLAQLFNKVGNPQFVDVTTFRLQPTSPAANEAAAVQAVAAAIVSQYATLYGASLMIAPNLGAM